MARRKKRSTLWDVLFRYLSGLVYFLSCFNPFHYLPQSVTEAINGRWSEAILALFQTETSRKRQLLRWVQEKVPDKHPRDWTASWSDGTLLCALVEALVPGTCPRYDLLNPSQGLNNARLGLKLAERNLGVAQLIAPEEISDSRLQSSDRLARYVSRLRQVSMRMENTNSQSKRVISPQVSLEDTVVRDICTVSGSGLTVAEVNREATFNIFARSSTIIDFEVQIKVPTGQVTTERVRQRAGLSVETFNQIFLEHKRKQVMQTRTNQKGRPRPRREQDPEKVYLGFVCTHDGFFQVSYTPKKAGFHLITVLWMGSPVEGCPFRVRAQDSSLEQNKMVLFKDQQEITTPKTARWSGGPESSDRVQIVVSKNDERKKLDQQSSMSGSEAGTPSEDGGYVGGTYRRRVVKQPSGGSDSSTQEMAERKRISIRQGSGNQEQSDSDVSEGAFRRRVIRQESGGSVDISDSEITESKRGGQRAAKMERQNSASGIVTKRKVLNITVMGEDISDASRRASIFKSSSCSQGSFMSQQSSDKVDQAGEEAKSGRWVSVEDKKIGACQPGGKTESAIEEMSKKLSNEVIEDSFGELAFKVLSEARGNEPEALGNDRGRVFRGVDDEALKARRRTLVKQSSLVPYLKEEGPHVIPSRVQHTSQNPNTNITASENKRQRLVHQSSLIPYLKENGQTEVGYTHSTDSEERAKHDGQRSASTAQAAPPDAPHPPRKPAAASRHRVLVRQSSLVPYMKSASDERVTNASEQRQLQVTPEISVSLESVATTQNNDDAETVDVKSSSKTSDDQSNTDKRPVPNTTRRLVKQSSLIPYMKLASVMSEAEEKSPESISDSDSSIEEEDRLEDMMTPGVSCLEEDSSPISTASNTNYTKEDTQSSDRLLSLQEFLSMEPPNGVDSSSQRISSAEPQEPTVFGPILITDDTLMSLKEFLSLSTFEQMQAINLMQKSTQQTKTSVTAECIDLNTRPEHTTEETLLSLNEFLALRIQEESSKDENSITPRSEGNNSDEGTIELSDDALITLKEFLSLRDIAERRQPMSTSKETSQIQQLDETNIFHDHRDANTTPENTGSGLTSKHSPDPTVVGCDSGWQDDIYGLQNPFVTNLLTTDSPQECHNAQEDLLTSEMGFTGVSDDRNKNNPDVSSTEQSSKQHSVNVHPVRQEGIAKERELNVVNDLVDIGPDHCETLPSVLDASVIETDTVETSGSEDQWQNGQSRRKGKNVAPLQRQSSLVPYLKQAEEAGISAPACRDQFEHKDFACDVIPETEDAERSCTSDRPSVSTLVKNWEEVTRNADDTAPGPRHQRDDNAGNGSNLPVANGGVIVGKASLLQSPANDDAIVGNASLLEFPLDDVEAIVFSGDMDHEETFSIVADVQIEGDQGGDVDIFNTIMAQLNHMDSPVYDSDLDNMDMNQEWIIIDTNPTVKPKNITPAMPHKEASKRMTVRYRSEILVDIGSEYDLESQITSPFADGETKDDAEEISLNGGGLVRKNQRVKSASERKLSFMADDGNFPSLFVTTIDDPHGDDVQSSSERVPTPSSDGGARLESNRRHPPSFSSSSLLMVVPNTGTGNVLTGEGEQESCHWSISSVEATNENSAIQFNPAGNTAAFLPSKYEQFQSTSHEGGQHGMMYRSSVTLEVNQYPRDSYEQSEVNMLRAEPHRNGRRRRPIRDSFRKAVVDKQNESPDGFDQVLASDCIERDALNSGFMDSCSPYPQTRVDISHKSLQVHSHQIRKETGYQDSMREEVRSRQGAIRGVSSIRNLLRSVDEKVSELSDIASEVMHNSSQHRNSLAEALRAAARKTSGEAGTFDDDVARRTTRQSTDDSGISDVTIYVDGKGPYTWQERHNISSLEDRIPYWLLNEDDSDSCFSPGGLRIPNESERACKSDSECVTRRPDRTSTPEIEQDGRRRSNVSLPDTESMHDFTAQLENDGTFANMRPLGRRFLPGESASIQASRQSWAGFPHSMPRRAAFSPGADGYEAGDEPNEEDEGDLGSRKADGRSRSRVLAGRILAFGPGLDHGFVGAKNNFQVSTRNAGNGALNVSLVGPRKNTVAEVNVIYTGDDLYEVIYDVTQPGYYVLSVKWMDRNIPESPFIVKIHEAWSVPNIPIPKSNLATPGNA
eukprot:XP_002605522.1 hypothetical protein BRAFLDRAFT_104088 [Branchiostoma floridae]